MQNHTNQIIAHFRQWKIKINERKTELLFFSRKKKKQYLPLFTINNEIIAPKKTAKYLGVLLDDKLSFTAQIQAIKVKAQKTNGMLHHLICRKSAL